MMVTITTAERPGRCCKEASRRQDNRPTWKDDLDNSDYYLNYQIIIRLVGQFQLLSELSDYNRNGRDHSYDKNYLDSSNRDSNGHVEGRTSDKIIWIVGIFMINTIQTIQTIQTLWDQG